jgi:hypothetical protein
MFGFEYSKFGSSTTVKNLSDQEPVSRGPRGKDSMFVRHWLVIDIYSSPYFP